MDANWRVQIARLAKCAWCKSRLVPFENPKGKIIYYICPKMQKKKCDGCYMKEEIFIANLTKLLRKRRIEIVVEER